MEKAEFP